MGETMLLATGLLFPGSAEARGIVAHRQQAF